MSGKGDDPRPLSVPQDEFNRRWDAIDWGARERDATTVAGILDGSIQPADASHYHTLLRINGRMPSHGEARRLQDIIEGRIAP